MRGPDKLALAASVTILLGVSTARASGLDDASAGLSALQTGNYDSAVILLSKAIKSGELTGDSLELAYNCRGRAYLGKHDYWAAIADLDQARRLKPDDAEAQSNLTAAISAVQPADEVPGQSAGRIFGKIGRSLLKATISGIAQGLAEQPQ